MKRSIQKINIDFSMEKLNRDLEKYRQEAITLGASDSKIITTDMIPIDDRVALKCRIPPCFGYGTSINCPPHTVKPSEFRELVKEYKHAVFLRLDVKPNV